MTEKVIEGHQTTQTGLNGLQTVLGRDADRENALFGVQTPRIHTPLNDRRITLTAMWTGWLIWRCRMNTKWGR